MNIAKRLRSIRVERRMTMKETAIKLSVPISTYRDWEYGRKIPAQVISKIALVFGVSPNELVEGKQQDGDEKKQIVELLDEVIQRVKNLS